MAWLDDIFRSPDFAALKRKAPGLPKKFVHSRTTGELLQLNPLEQLFLSQCIAGMDPKDAEKHVIDKFGTSDSRSFTRRIARDAWDELARHGLIARADESGIAARKVIAAFPENQQLRALVPTLK